MPNKAVKVVCCILLISTLCIIGLLYRSDLNESSDLLTRYNDNTQHFDRTTATTVIEKSEETGKGKRPGDGTLVPTLPGVPTEPTPPGQVPSDLADLIFMSFDEVFPLIMNDQNADWATLVNWNSSTEAALNAAKSTNSTHITVPVWNWKTGTTGYDDSCKVSVTKDIECNSVISELVKLAFEEAYTDPSKPVIATAGGWNIRTTSGGRTSGHAFGCAIDVNENADVLYNGVHYTNRQLASAPTVTTALWQQLPDSRNKYELMYSDHPLVKAFHKYGFQWGGEWSSSRDGMHFSFVGDNGAKARTIGQGYARSSGAWPGR